MPIMVGNQHITQTCCLGSENHTIQRWHLNYYNLRRQKTHSFDIIIQVQVCLNAAALTAVPPCPVSSWVGRELSAVLQASASVRRIGHCSLVAVLALGVGREVTDWTLTLCLQLLV